MFLKTGRISKNNVGKCEDFRRFLTATNAKLEKKKRELQMTLKMVAHLGIWHVQNNVDSLIRASRFCVFPSIACYGKQRK